MKRDTYNETAASLRRAFWLSILSVMLCVSMLLGSTMAWFTDSEGFSQEITVGHLAAQVLMTDDESGQTLVFTDPNSPAVLSADDSVTFSELRLDPGQALRRTVVVDNTGSIPFRYQLLAEAGGGALAELLECTLTAPGEQPDWSAAVPLTGEVPVEITAGTLAEGGELTLELYLRLPASVSSAFAGEGADLSVYLLAMQADAPEDFLTGEVEQ